MDKENALFLGKGGVTQRREQRRMSRSGVHHVTECPGPTRDRKRAVTSGSKSLPQIATISPHCRFHPSANHPLQHLARVGRELQLQQLLPHFLMRPAQEGYIAGEPMAAPQNSAAEIEKLVDSGQHRVAV